MAAMKTEFCPNDVEMVRIGEWGDGTADGGGYWFARPEDVEAVQAAYDAMDDYDTSEDATADIREAGGIHFTDIELR